VNNTAMLEGRRADSARRRQRVIKAINDATRTGEELSVSAIARKAGVDRTFLYRHRDLLEQVHAAEARPAATSEGGALVSRASLQADLHNALERNYRLTTRVRQLERKLSELLGEQAWRESGLGAPEDIDKLKRRLIQLEQQAVDLTAHLEDRTAELDAARAANRELMTQLNHATRPE
jgi:Family of unknown function (DUF6262)